MNSSGHLFVSLLKSLIRIASCTFSVCLKSIVPLAIGFAIAEVLGIIEELVDER